MAPARPAVPMTVEGDTRELQLAFLARWYPELRDRIPHRTQDPIRRDALFALVERLNAAAWETEDQNRSRTSDCCRGAAPPLPRVLEAPPAPAAREAGIGAAALE